MASTTALAHPAASGGFLHGFVHPFTGPDHLAAMLVVGMWAARVRGAPRWIVPVAFLTGMVTGALGAGAGAFLPAVEPIVAASVFVLGAALALRMWVYAAVVLLAAAGLFHGFAHLAEMPGGVSFALFTAGMLAGSALLHAIGLAIGLLVAAARPRVA